MRKHWKVTSYDWQLAALEAQRQTAKRAEAHAAMRRKQIISALKYAGYTFVLVAFAAVAIGLIAIVLGVR